MAWTDLAASFLIIREQLRIDKRTDSGDRGYHDGGQMKKGVFSQRVQCPYGTVPVADLRHSTR